MSPPSSAKYPQFGTLLQATKTVICCFATNLKKCRKATNNQKCRKTLSVTCAKNKLYFSLFHAYPALKINLENNQKIKILTKKPHCPKPKSRFQKITEKLQKMDHNIATLHDWDKVEADMIEMASRWEGKE